MLRKEDNHINLMRFVRLAFDNSYMFKNINIKYHLTESKYFYLYNTYTKMEYRRK